MNVSDPAYEWMNVRALLTQDAPYGSVRFYLNEAPYRVENRAPYIMVSGTRKWWSGPGSYTLEATPFSRKNGNGIPGKSHKVTFIIVDHGSDRGNDAGRLKTSDEKLPSEFVGAYPIPTRRFIHVYISRDHPDLVVQLVIRNLHSQVLFNETRYVNAQPFTLDLEKMGLNDGIYYLQMRSTSINRSIRFVKE